MELTDVLGYAAAFLTTVSFVPQAWRTFRTKDVSGISLKMYSVFTVGVAVWLAYSLALGEPPMIASNAVTLVLACAVLGMKLRYGKKARAGEPAAQAHSAAARAAGRRSGRGKSDKRSMAEA
jgi:MtN3 and saliva related transmembrane protein